MKFLAGENGRNPEKTYPDSVSSTTKHRGTEMRTRDPSGERRSSERLHHGATPNFVCLSPKYISKHFFLEHLKLLLLSQDERPSFTTIQIQPLI